MSIGLTVDTKEFIKAMKGLKLSKTDMLVIEKPGALVNVNQQRALVPVDTALTKNSIGQHIEEATRMRVVDEIGPETDYSPSIEYGIDSKPGYPMQPFVRPSAQNAVLLFKAISAAFGKIVERRWPI